MSEYKNLGIAVPKVEILNNLPQVRVKQEVYNFDATAFSYKAFLNSPFFSPLLTEQIVDVSDNFSALHPSKRKYYVDNMMKDSGESTESANLIPLTAPNPLIPLTATNPSSNDLQKLNKTLKEAESTQKQAQDKLDILVSGGGSSADILVAKDALEHTQAALTKAQTEVANAIIKINNKNADGGDEEDSAEPFIVWTPCGPKGPVNPGVITDIANRYEDYYAVGEGSAVNPNSQVPIPGKIALDTYSGPRWTTAPYKSEPQPDDNLIVKKFFEMVSGSGDDDDDDVVGDVIVEEEGKTASIDAVFQEVAKDGLWWGIESSEFLETNMPFWVTINKPSKSSAPNKYKTMYVISLGIDSNNNSDRYDLVLDLNTKPKLIDYNGVNVNDTSGKPNIREFDVEASRLIPENTSIHIGFMTVGARLVIIVNGETLVYTRIKKSGSDDDIGRIKQAKIHKGKIRIYGTNTKAQVLAYPMTFAPLSVIAFPVPNKKRIDVGGGETEVEIEYSASSTEGEPTERPVILLPTPEDTPTRYGIDCRRFTDANDELHPDSTFGFHRDGRVKFFSAVEVEDELAALPDTNFFILTMRPDKREWGEHTIKYAKTPYFFQLKGVDKSVRTGPPIISTNVTDKVLSITENANAPDYFHIKKTATITLYNEYGEFNSLRDKQKGVRISWGWRDINGAVVKRTFTGLVINASSSEVAGRETLVLQCEDYMYIFKTTPIVNSPFYDGMIGFYAIRDLAKRAGIKDPEKDWVGDEDYFLPSGYSFSKPKVRFKQTDKIFDCIMNIVQRFEAYIYFDGEGVLHIDKLEGSLLSNPTPPYTNFTTNPLDTGKILILEEKNIDYDFSNTVNHISVLTLDRDTRNPIIYATTPKSGDNKLLFKKKVLLDQPALGGVEEARAWAYELGLRMFSSIIKTRFKTAGTGSIIDPLAFIKVDGKIFRLMTINRTYNAETNDFTQSYEAEWLGG